MSQTVATATDTDDAALLPARFVTKVDHVGIAVPDLDVAIEWYGRVLGLVCTHIEVNEGQGVREAMLSVGDGPTMIQLLCPLNPDTTIGKFIAKNGPGIQQMAYTVNDLAAASAHIRAQGARLLYDEARIGTAGSLINFMHPKDAGGVLVELVQPGTSDHH